eukprot:6545396-Pyramimonas_sp.AAC.1
MSSVARASRQWYWEATHLALVAMIINLYKSRVRTCVGGGGAGKHCEGLQESVETTWRQGVAVAIR